MCDVVYLTLLPALANEKKVETTLQLLLAYAFKLVYDF